MCDALSTRCRMQKTESTCAIQTHGAWRRNSLLINLARVIFIAIPIIWTLQANFGRIDTVGVAVLFLIYLCIYVLYGIPCYMTYGICGLYCHTILPLNLLTPGLTFLTKLFFRISKMAVNKQISWNKALAALAFYLKSSRT